MFCDALPCRQCHFQILEIFVLYCSAGRGHTPVQKRKHHQSMDYDSMSLKSVPDVVPSLQRYDILIDPNDAHRYGVTTVLLISGVFYLYNVVIM